MLRAADFRHIVVLTGAGISRSAGIPTFRGPGGLWTDPELAALSHVESMIARRGEVCAMYWSRRRGVGKVSPTAAHRALAAFAEARRDSGDSTFLLVTQNVDGLHTRAGSRSVVEYHGSLARWRCDECGEKSDPPDGDAPPEHCGVVMRPEIVMFGEMIPADAEHTVKRALRDCDLFVAIGTSGSVTPAAGFVRAARYAGAKTILCNLDAFDGAHDEFDEVRLGTSDELVPPLFA
jgi:NAD-dependent deacetylase